MYPYVYCSTMYNSHDRETTSEFINRWIDKQMRYIYNTQNGILFSHIKDRNPTICNNMGGPLGHYAKWNKSAEKDKHHIISPIYEIIIKKASS